MHKKMKDDMEQHESWCPLVGLQGLGIHAVRVFNLVFGNNI